MRIRLVLAVSFNLLTAATAQEPSGPETFSKRSDTPPPPDPVLQENKTPPLKLGVGMDMTSQVSFSSAAVWANASVDLSRVEIHASDSGRWTHLVAREVARQLATNCPAETVTYVPWGAKLLGGVPRPGAAYILSTGVRSAGGKSGFEVTLAGGHPPLDGPRHLSTDGDFPESSFSWQTTHTVTSGSAGFGLKQSKEVAARNAATSIAERLAEHLKERAEAEPLRPEMPAEFFPPFAPAPEFAFFAALGLETRWERSGFLLTNHTLWQGRSHQPAPEVLGEIRGELKAAGWTVTDEGTAESPPFLYLRHPGGLQAIGVWWANPDDFVFSDTKAPDEPVFFVEYVSRPAADQRQEWLGTLLDYGKLSLAQALVLEEDWRRSADEARILALMEAAPIGTSAPRPWAQLYLRLVLRGKSGPAIIPPLKRAFWRNLLESRDAYTDELLSPYREELPEETRSQIDWWDAETMRALGLVDLSVTPEGSLPYRTGDALYFFEADSRGSLAWVRYEGRPPHPPDRVETGRMTLDDSLESRRSWGTQLRDIVWKGGPDGTTLNLPAETIRTILQQEEDGSWTLSWSAAP